MDFDLKAKDDLGKDSIIISHTNYDMYFGTLTKKNDSDLLPESMDLSIKDMNLIIKELNKESYRINNSFRLKEMEDFLGGHLNIIKYLFPFILISAMLMYVIINLNIENAR